eukprot:2888457-Rhodomonas_salina.2
MLMIIIVTRLTPVFAVTETVARRQLEEIGSHQRNTTGGGTSAETAEILHAMEEGGVRHLAKLDADALAVPGSHSVQQQALSMEEDEDSELGAESTDEVKTGSQVFREASDAPKRRLVYQSEDDVMVAQQSQVISSQRLSVLHVSTRTDMWDQLGGLTLKCGATQALAELERITEEKSQSKLQTLRYAKRLGIIFPPQKKYISIRANTGKLHMLDSSTGVTVMRVAQRQGIAHRQVDELGQSAGDRSSSASLLLGTSWRHLVHSLPLRWSPIMASHYMPARFL